MAKGYEVESKVHKEDILTQGPPAQFNGFPTDWNWFLNQNLLAEASEEKKTAEKPRQQTSKEQKVLNVVTVRPLGDGKVSVVSDEASTPTTPCFCRSQPRVVGARFHESGR